MPLPAKSSASRDSVWGIFCIRASWVLTHLKWGMVLTRNCGWQLGVSDWILMCIFRRWGMATLMWSFRSTTQNECPVYLHNTTFIPHNNQINWLHLFLKGLSQIFEAFDNFHQEYRSKQLHITVKIIQNHIKKHDLQTLNFQFLASIVIWVYQ